MPQFDASRRRFLLAIFVVSGFTGLIYESIWSHYLKLFLGHAAYAQTLVLAIFMGGLALGSWLVARYCSRLRNLLWGYLLVEALTGVLGILFHRVFVAASDVSFSTIIPALPSGAAIYAYKWVLAALLILPQSTLLGMTFPLISGGIIRRWPERAGETLATLYFTNSLGAAFGVLISGFVLIGMVGLPGTVLTAGLLNMALAFAVWVIVRREAEPAPAGPVASDSRSATPSAANGASWFAIAAFVTGVASFMYELGWIRMLSLVLGSATHSFELMLAAFIFGLAFGGLYVRKRIDGIANPEIYLGGVMAVMGALAALTLPAGNAMFDFMAWALATFTPTTGGYVAFNAVSQVIAALLMVPVTFCAGMTLPILSLALMRRGQGEKAIGTIYAVNTLGAIVGVLLTVHVLMPWIGIKGVILGGAALHLALGLSRLRLRRGWPGRAAVATAASLVVVGSIALFGRLDPQRLASGVFRTGTASLPADSKVLYLHDGKTATVSVILEEHGIMAIATNGKPDAGLRLEGEAAPDEATMVLVAGIPLSMHPNPARVANIGFGAGVTSHEVLTSAQVKRLDTIEIEPAMVDAARRNFGPRIHNVFEDPRSHIVYEDAKTFFAASREPYDLIMSEPSNPWVSGVATLFSDEFYGRVRQYLKPDGYFVQWLQIYETDMDIVASVLKAMSAHFGAFQIYNLNDLDILLVATPAASLPPPSERIFQSPQMRAELDRIGVQSVADLERRLVGDRRTLTPLLRTLAAPANSDYFPFVDLNAPRLRFMQKNATELVRLTLLPVPFLDLLRDDSPRGPTREPSKNSRLRRDAAVRRALAIHHALATGRVEDLDPLSASSLLLIGVSGERCADPGALAAWMAQVRWLSDSTANFLSPPELADVWGKIRSSACYRGLGGDDKAWVDLLSAVAARDAQEIVRLGAPLLQSPTFAAKDKRDYLATATGAAYVRLGQAPQALRLLGSQWHRLDEGGDYGLALRQLIALTLPQSGEALVQASR
jgi:spermidine synthase